MTARPRKTAAPKPNFAALLANARLPEGTIELCMRPDLLADFEALDRQLVELADKPNPKMGDDGRAALRKEIEALEAEMRANTYPFRLRALPTPAFRALMAAHPPRRDAEGKIFDPRDATLRLNSETFFDALARASIIDPEITDEQWQQMLGIMSDRHIDRLANLAWELNQADVNIPFSQGVLKMNRSSEPD